MYGLPENFDASVLVGLTVEMVCFTGNQISLHFDVQTKIVVEAMLEYQSASGQVQKLVPPVSSTNLMQLIGHKITQALGQADGTLFLLFDNDDSVRCCDVSSNYESYQIVRSDKTIII